MEIKINKVDNGFVMSISKKDVLTGVPEVSITVYPSWEKVLEKLQGLS